MSLPESGSDSGQRRYKVVVNDEEQYSIWLAGRPVPDGWHEEGTAATEDECVAHIEQVWVDMRPLSLRGAPAHSALDPQASGTHRERQ